MVFSQSELSTVSSPPAFNLMACSLPVITRSDVHTDASTRRSGSVCVECMDGVCGEENRRKGMTLRQNALKRKEKLVESE